MNQVKENTVFSNESGKYATDTPKLCEWHKTKRERDLYKVKKNLKKAVNYCLLNMTKGPHFSTNIQIKSCFDEILQNCVRSGIYI